MRVSTRSSTSSATARTSGSSTSTTPTSSPAGCARSCRSGPATTSAALSGSLGDNVRAFLAAQGVAWSAHRIVMLANARTLGYVFDPLSVYWCYARPAGSKASLPRCTTRTASGTAMSSSSTTTGAGDTSKEFYVSPFFGVFGDYRLKFVRDGDKVGAFVTLKQDGRVVFTGSFTGRARAGHASPGAWRWP